MSIIGLFKRIFTIDKLMVEFMKGNNNDKLYFNQFSLFEEECQRTLFFVYAGGMPNEVFSNKNNKQKSTIMEFN